MTVQAPYGSWPSPISAERVASGAVALHDVRAVGAELYWLETRAAEAGRTVVVRRSASGEIGDVTPSEIDVRTRVHEYGGGAYLPTHGAIFFVNFADQRVYRHEPGGTPQPITPEPARPGALRYADFEPTADGRLLFCVREVHDAGEPVNELVALRTDGSEEPRVVASGADFYSFPRLSPDGSRLVWTCWHHPQMPWDGTEMWLGEVGRGGQLSGARRIAGGPAESIFQPGWSPEGVLHFVSDRSGWWNLYTWHDGEALPLAPLHAEFGRPQWGFAMSTYTFLGDGRIACVFSSGGVDALGLIDDTGGRGVTEVKLPYSSLGRGVEAWPAAGRATLALVAASPRELPAVVSIDAGSGACSVLRRSGDLDLPPEALSEPSPIEFPSAGGRTAHALYYPPRSATHEGPHGERPPLLVVSHGGPTAATSSAFSPSLQYWTSRGFAVVDVNYGGSTGYGRAYRERLRGQWGVVDTEDCVAVARYLAAEGRVDPAHMAIRGGSAGGYTTLCALTFHQVFAAGASYYGVADAETLARDTHKFESRYLDSLIGPYPEQQELYRERSPIHFAEKLSCPLLILQGLDDPIVPPSQAEVMVAALEKRGLPHAYVAFEGEQHGFRRAENIAHALEAELYFYGRVFGFASAESAPIEIRNAENLPDR